MSDGETARTGRGDGDSRIGVTDIIICKDVTKWFGDFQALHGITTSVKEGEVVVIIGLTELLKAAQQVTAQPDFIGRQAEALMFVALIYWVVAFSMSRASQQLERTLGVGER